MTQKYNSIEYWKQNEQSKPVLARLAWTFLCAPPGSVSSEQLFSTAADFADGKRNRLPKKFAITWLSVLILNCFNENQFVLKVFKIQ